LRIAAAAAGLALGLGTAAYWVVGLVPNTGDYYAAGPYHVNLGLLVALGVAGLAAGVASAAALARRASRGQLSGFATSRIMVLTIGAVLTAVMWRTMTHGVEGANIGGGLLMLATVAYWLVVGLVFAIGPWRHAARETGQPPNHV
jgi:hypothetical protein